MAHPQEARLSCRECNGWYNSERELQEHMQTAHRRCGSEQSTLQHGHPPDGFEKQRVTPSVGMTRRPITFAAMKPVSIVILSSLQRTRCNPHAQQHAWRAAMLQVIPLGQL
jgi:ribosomal protein L44E